MSGGYVLLFALSCSKGLDEALRGFEEILNGLQWGSK